MRCIKTLLALILLPSLVWADGVLTPAANPSNAQETVVFQSAIPFIIPSSGSVGNNGAVSGLTAMRQSFSGGAWMYMAANTISAGSAAGWYWYVGSSTTAGTLYNSTYTSGVPRPGTATAFSTTGPGAFTGVTTNTLSISLSLPSNLMGANGQLSVHSVQSHNNTAGSKWTAWWWGGFSGGDFFSNLDGANQTSASTRAFVSNRGSASIQTLGRVETLGSGIFTAINAADSTKNTKASVLLEMGMRHATATDYVVNEQFVVTVRYAQ